MNLFLALLSVSFLVFVINVIPAFMPATWMFLAFVYIQYNLPFLPLVLLGAIFSTLGRAVLYKLSLTHFKRFLPKISQENLAILGKYLNNRKNITAPLVVFFAFLPLPSNVAFIGAGFAKFDLKILLTGFFIGRFINYFLLVSGSSFIALFLRKFVSSHYSFQGTLILELVGFASLFLITKINWGNYLKV